MRPELSTGQVCLRSLFILSRFGMSLCKCQSSLIRLPYNKEGIPIMEYTCMQCNENKVTVTELYCFTCYLDREAEAMIDSDLIDQLFVTSEAN